MNSAMKRLWTIKTPGYPAFQMIAMDGEMTYEQALAEARSIWPSCEIW